MWDTIPIHGEKYISGDIARKGKDYSIIGVWNGLELYQIIKEEKSQLKDLSDTIKIIAQQESVRMSHTIMDENGVGGGVIDNLRCQGFINNARPRQPRKANISTVRNYDMLKTQCYFKLAETVQRMKVRYRKRSRNPLTLRSSLVPGAHLLWMPLFCGSQLVH